MTSIPLFTLKVQFEMKVLFYPFSLQPHVLQVTTEGVWYLMVSQRLQLGSNQEPHRELDC